MLRYTVAGLLVCAMVGAGIIVGGCGPDESPPDGVIRCRTATPVVRDSLRLLCPSGGETFHVGDKVEIKWSYPAFWPFTGPMNVDLYVEGGMKVCEDISPTPIDATDSASTDSWVWVIPQTFERRLSLGVRDTVHLAGQTQCYIKVGTWDWNAMTPDPAAYFSISE